MKLPKYRKQLRGKGKARGFAQLDGKRIYFPGEYGSPESKSAYDTWIRKTYPTVQSSDVLIEHVALAFLDWAKEEYGERDHHGRRRGRYHNLKTPVLRLVQDFSGTPADCLGPRALRLWRDDLADLGLSRSYINDTIQAVKQMYRWAVAEEMAKPDTYAAICSIPGLRAGKATRKHVEPVNESDVMNTVKWLSEPVRSMVLFQWHTGARGDSVCRAECSQFESRGTQVIWRPRHKTEKSHRVAVPLFPEAAALALEAIKRVGSGVLFAPPGESSRSMYDAGSYRQAIVRAIRRANRNGAQVKPWTPHQIRHAKATQWEAEYGIETARILLGHSTIRTTELYAETNIQRLSSITRSV